MVPKTHFRSAPRPQTSHEVTLRFSDGTEVSAFTKDVSRGGMFVPVRHPSAQGERLEVSLSSPSTWEPLRLSAEVCRVDKEPEAGLGLRFVQLTDRQLAALIALTNSLDFES